MLDLTKMISMNDFEPLMFASKEEICSNGGLKYIVHTLNCRGVNKDKLREIIAQHAKGNPGLFDDISNSII